MMQIRGGRAVLLIGGLAFVALVGLWHNAVDQAAPLGVVLGATVVATGVAIGVGYILSELKNGIFEDIGIS
jgi:hypothetical protein